MWERQGMAGVRAYVMKHSRADGRMVPWFESEIYAKVPVLKVLAA